MKTKTTKNLVSTFALDWKEFSDEARNEMKAALRPFGLYFGDAEQEYHGEAVSDTYFLYIAKTPLSRKELRKLLGP